MLAVTGLYDLAEKLLRNGQWVGFLVGAMVGGGACIGLLRRYLPSHWKEKVGALSEENGLLRSELARLGDQLDEITRHRDTGDQLLTTLRAQTDVIQADLKASSGERDRLLGEHAVGRDRLAQLEAKLAETEHSRSDLEAKFTTWLNRGVRKRWDQPLGAKAARFRPLQARTMPIISVINLKGGVGKTTITANLGVTLARERGLRVLMIDLDYQGSLSSLCLGPQELQDARQGHRSVQEVIGNGVADRTKEVFRNAIRLEDLDVGHAYLLAAEDRLDEAESQVMAHWLMGVSGDDVRFRLREALHNPQIRDEYDVVLLDCPPRLSTGCVNALAASDYVLIPVMPETTSAEATPRLLHWLRKYQNSFCPELSVLGVVANRVRFYQGKPVQKQQDLWGRLKEQCKAAWGAYIPFYDEAMIRQFANLPHRLAAVSPAGKGAMIDLANRVLKELPPYACRRPSAVPPVAPPSAPGVRG